jgi:undecaprenyl-diphosphatase
VRTPVTRNTLIAVLAIAFLVFIFGLIAQEVAGGETSAFDRRLILLLRDPANPSVAIGPAWLQEAARDVTSLGSIIVLAIFTLAAVGYLFLARERISAWLLLVAVFGGIALVDVLKAVFARPRPDLVLPAARVFTASFPSGHASLSAITYLTMGALLARAQSSTMIGRYFLALAAFLTVLIGVSRIYLGVHYPTDVLAGWCIGLAWAIACWVVAELLGSRRQTAPASRS